MDVGLIWLLLYHLFLNPSLEAADGEESESR